MIHLHKVAAELMVSVFGRRHRRARGTVSVGAGHGSQELAVPRRRCARPRRRSAGRRRSVLPTRGSRRSRPGRRPARCRTGDRGRSRRRRAPAAGRPRRPGRPAARKRSSRRAAARVPSISAHPVARSRRSSASRRFPDGWPRRRGRWRAPSAPAAGSSVRLIGRPISLATVYPTPRTVWISGGRPAGRSCGGDSRCRPRGSSSPARSRSPRSARRSPMWSRTMPALRTSSSSRSNSVLRQVDLARATPHPPCLRIDAQVGDLQTRARPASSALRAAQQRAEPGEQLLQRERLGKVVVGAGVEAGHPIGCLGPRREHQDREPVLLAAQHPAGGQAVDDRHHHVENDDVGRVGAKGLQRLGAVGDRDDRVALEREGTGQRFAHGALVFGNKNRVLTAGFLLVPSFSPTFPPWFSPYSRP